MPETKGIDQYISGQKMVSHAALSGDVTRLEADDLHGMGNTRKVLDRTSWEFFATSAEVSKQQAKRKPRPHAKVPAKAGALSPQPAVFYMRRVVSKFTKQGFTVIQATFTFLPRP
ncbi:MAG: hypothetical protein V1791_12765 [Pseudomonadota bacterium]